MCLISLISDTILVLCVVVAVDGCIGKPRSRSAIYNSSNAHAHAHATMCTHAYRYPLFESGSKQVREQSLYVEKI